MIIGQLTVYAQTLAIEPANAVYHHLDPCCRESALTPNPRTISCSPTHSYLRPRRRNSTITQGEGKAYT
ncbi:unnamed protein product, partial [Iphiclides podalirius]